MLSAKQLSAIQRVGQKTFTLNCTIYKRQPFAFDDSNPYGDDTVTFATVGTKVNGWLVPSSTTDFMMDIAQIISSGNSVLRVAVGTDIEPGDKVVIGTDTYYCSESTVEQTWPEWITVRLRRVQ
jgi:hypothetical protein